MDDLNEDSIDIETEEFFYNLVQLAPTEDAILDVMREGIWFQVVLRAPTTRLTNDEKIMMMDANFVDWAGFSANVLLANAVYRGTSMNNCPPRSKKLTACKLRIIQAFQQNNYPESVLGNSEKMIRWASGLRAIAIEFCRLLEEGALRKKRPLNEVIAEILANDWSPLDNAHAETIYYIAGCILQMINNLSKKHKGELGEALEILRNSVMTSKNEAKQRSLPSARVEKREKKQLTYANSEFYHFLLKVESVYQSLLKETNVAMFGVGIVCDIGYVLESFSVETGFSKLLPDSVRVETKESIYRAILKSFSNTRGKDFSYKKNAKAPPNTQQGLRPELAVASQIAKAKREKSKAESKEEKRVGKKGHEKDSTSATATASTIVPKEGMCVAVKYEEGTYTGKIVKVTESDNSHKILVSWDCDDPDDEFIFPDPEDGIVLMNNEQGIIQADGDCHLYNATDDEMNKIMNDMEKNFTCEE